MENAKDVQRWMNLAESILNEDSENRISGVDDDIEKIDSDLMSAKAEKLNALIKRRYYEKDQEIDDSKVFQFQFVDRGEYYEFTIPLYILFGKKSREFTAHYWNDFFGAADIDVSFEDNIEDALKNAGKIHLTMKLDKKLKKEIPGSSDDNKEE
jgi:hypothetical protein